MCLYDFKAWLLPRQRKKSRISDSWTCDGESQQWLRLWIILMHRRSTEQMWRSLPGPFAPPCINRPKRKMTARSYSWTTCNNQIRFNYLDRRMSCPWVGFFQMIYYLECMEYWIHPFTLKQTNKLNGMVRTTTTQDKTINAFPHDADSAEFSSSAIMEKSFF